MPESARRVRPPTARERAREDADLTVAERRARALAAQQAALNRQATGQVTGPRLEAYKGKLVVKGAGERLLAQLPGACWSHEHRWWELSLTLRSLRAVRATLGYDRPAFTGCCSEPVLAWARRAGQAEARVLALHQKMATGWRTPLPWLDRRAGTVAGPEAEDREVEMVGGHRVYRYRAPFAHQQVMATVAAELDGMANLGEMGTGKTRAIVEAAAESFRRGLFDVLLVVCPRRVMPTWRREVQVWTDVFRVPVLLEGSLEGRKARIQALVAEAPALRRSTVLVVNWEALASLQEDLLALAQAGRLGFVPDESHKAANPNAARTKAMLRLAPRCPWRAPATGTPIKLGAHDLWSQWYAVDCGLEFGASYVQFRREHLNENPYAHEMTLKPGAAEGIRDRLSLRGVRYRKEDCLDLPPKVPVLYETTMAPAQEAAYRQMERDLLVRLREQDEDPDTVATAATQLTMILRLSQITSGFLVTESGAIHRFPENPKLDMFADVLEDLLDDGRSAVAWAWYREDQARLLDRFSRYRPLAMLGGQTLDQHEALERAFQRGESPLVVCNQASGGAGITLTRAGFAGYYSQGYSLIDRIQSEDRIHRPGSERHTSVTIADFVLRDTIDGVVLDAIAKKKDTAATLLALRANLESHV
jgi:hypothetical protein